MVRPASKVCKLSGSFFEHYAQAVVKVLILQMVCGQDKLLLQENLWTGLRCRLREVAYCQPGVTAKC